MVWHKKQLAKYACGTGRKEYVSKMQSFLDQTTSRCYLLPLLLPLECLRLEMELVVDLLKVNLVLLEIQHRVAAIYNSVLTNLELCLWYSNQAL